ncbi:ParB N-terminal domain-containing protein [Flavobacteriaceae bacterium]|nr:ParB N-terminal domain-containing protein [Flavobacteriaceae bacterium]
MNIIIKNVPLETLELHPKLIGIKSSIKPEQLKKFLPSIRIYGIIEPLKVIRENHKYFIVDGFVRYQTVLTNNVEIESVPVQEISITDADVILESLLRNTRIKRSYLEIAKSAYHLLHLIGTSQGKKRVDIGPLKSVDDFGQVSKDRFQLTCSILSLDFSPTTLRRLVRIYEAYLNDELMGAFYFNRLDSGESIIKIYEMTCLSTDEKRKKEDRRLELAKEKLDREKNAQDQLKEKYLREGYEKAKKEIEEEEEGLKIRSLSDQLWQDKIQKLDEIRYRISIDDERILDAILNKYS